ncbi:hypothetical protein ACMXYO_09725 [Neptuniibacter sp. QD37_6]|uniref:hypothetical protein n=1 Tax=Neptuniibacter sp. QD37_6 TaxID=3398210 RepID=UPI0039F6025B
MKIHSAASSPLAHPTKNRVETGISSNPAQQLNTQQNSFSQIGKIVSATDKQGLIELGRMAIGNNTLKAWESQGFEVSDEGLIAAAKAFQQGFKQIADQLSNQTAGSSVSINKHQILIDNQQNLPQWFIDEYDYLLQNLSDDSHRSAFAQGDHFYAKTANNESIAVQNYQTVTNYGQS